MAIPDVSITRYGDEILGGSVADGSETKVTAGTGITVTGSGTTASPYVVRTTAGAVGSYAQLTNTNAVSPVPAIGAKVNLTTLNSNYGTYVTPNAAAAQITLKAGGVYKVEGALLPLFSNGVAAVRYAIYANGVKIGTDGTALPVTQAQNSFGNNQASAFLAPTVDTVIELRIVSIGGTLTQLGGFQLVTTGKDCFLNAHCIGLQ